ncbi:NAD(P)/FAD-dependent oxidoreductase [Allomuricauda sp. d1]|uniref:NAD(P)/FAD-dependent oxidoreductase n=1 Tax=Allomuricauda sp. d1 TaxID=3136725 RepID=UPI0031DCC67E
MFDVIIIGGGAAGFYAAISIAERNPKLSIAIFERGKTVLGKVKVSGGGRCNVTHAEFSPHDLSQNYPRGAKELIGPFHSHAVTDTVAFFEDRGVSLKVEQDGRIFPKTDSSQTIIDCFLEEVKRLKIKVLKNSSVKNFEWKEKEKSWRVTTMNKHYHSKKLLVATGSNPKIWKLLKELGHKIVDPVPSLFTFNIADKRLEGLQGISAEAYVEIPKRTHYDSDISDQIKTKVEKKPLLTSEGPVLITHWGLSGPAILRLSAWGARLLNEYRYHFKIELNWLPEFSTGSFLQYLLQVKEVESKKAIYGTTPVDIPSRLWKKFVKASGIDTKLRWADITKEKLGILAEQLTKCSFKVTGKSTFKEEFVTAGGVDLKEIDFKTFQSKLLPNLYFAGEVMNVDAITGGFNFQNAWTSAYLAARAIAD